MPAAIAATIAAQIGLSALGTTVLSAFINIALGLALPAVGEPLRGRPRL